MLGLLPSLMAIILGIITAKSRSRSESGSSSQVSSWPTSIPLQLGAGGVQSAEPELQCTQLRFASILYAASDNAL